MNDGRRGFARFRASAGHALIVALGDDGFGAIESGKKAVKIRRVNAFPRTSLDLPVRLGELEFRIVQKGCHERVQLTPAVLLDNEVEHVQTRDTFRHSEAVSRRGNQLLPERQASVFPVGMWTQPRKSRPDKQDQLPAKQQLSKRVDVRLPRRSWWY